VDAPSATFLGFPDGGLGALLAEPEATVAYESPWTRAAAAPYPDAAVPGARYVHGELVASLARIVERARPDWIALPTPLDTHADHCATFAFVVHALARRVPAAAPRLLAYLVHAGNWPPGPGEPGPLPVPAATFAGARWWELPLAPAELAAKRAALGAHRTQTAVMDGFLRSLTRANELFAVVEPDAVGHLDPDAIRCPSQAGNEPSPGGGPPPAHVQAH
jgi:LmbE family N-acetylglucosaminyl deacetylase